jgi:hypothetical protein
MNSKSKCIKNLIQNERKLKIYINYIFCELSSQLNILITLKVLTRPERATTVTQEAQAVAAEQFE